MKSKKGKKSQEDSEESDMEDLDDEEVSLGSMDEEDFGEELEEEGGTFMDPDGREAALGHIPIAFIRVWLWFVPLSVPELEDAEDEDVPDGRFFSFIHAEMFVWEF